MAELGKIVIGMDLGERSLEMARWVRKQLAPGAQLVLVHVVEPPPLSVFYRGVLPPREKMVEEAMEPARARLAELAEELGDEAVMMETRAGRPAECIARVADDEKADLVVVGRHRRGPHMWGELGSTAEELFHFARVPILLPHDLPDHITTVLMPIEDSALTPRIMDWAQTLAEKYDARVVAVHVLSLLLRGHLRLLSTKERTERTEAAARAAAETHIRGVLEGAGFDMDRTAIDIRLGHADRQILEARAEHSADAIVMGSHGPGELERAVIGSCANTVTRQAPCPVLVVLERGEQT